MKTAAAAGLLALCLLAVPHDGGAQTLIVNYPNRDIAGPSDAAFTLSGTVSLELLTEETMSGGNGRARTAVVRCWICTDMTCGDNGFGPAWYLRNVEGEHDVQFGFTAYFAPWEPATATSNGEGPNPLDIHSYYCNLGLSALPISEVIMTPALIIEPSYTLPSDVPSVRWAKAADGSPLVVELSGTIG